MGASVAAAAALPHRRNADRPEGSVEAEIAQMLKDEDHKVRPYNIILCHEGSTRSKMCHVNCVVMASAVAS